MINSQNIDRRLVRYGILGLGIGMAHAAAAAASDKCLLCAVADLDEDRRNAFAEEYPEVHIFSTLEEMLEAEALDAVSICLPTGMHADYASRALRAGCHVLVEKPIDTTLEKAEALAAAAQCSGKKCAAVFQNRYNYGLDPVFEGIANGTLGKVLLGNFAVKWYRDDKYYAANGAWRGTWDTDGGGSLMNQSIHTVDLMLCLMGKPKSITSHIRVFGHDIESEDTTVSIIEFESGALATFTSTTCAYPGICTEIALTCEHGSAALDGDRLIMFKTCDSERDSELLARYSVGNRKAQRVCPGRKFGHKRVVDDFCAAILEDAPVPVGLSEGMLPLRVILGAYESAKTGKTVYFD